MLAFASLCFVLALITSVLAFAGVAGLSAQTGWIFAVIAVLFLALACSIIEVSAAVARFRERVSAR